jgi:hypothetical protein
MATEHVEPQTEPVEDGGWVEFFKRMANEKNGPTFEEQVEEVLRKHGLIK